MRQIKGESEDAVDTTARRTEYANHTADNATSPSHPASTKTEVASVAGCLFLVTCASITTYCAILSELQGWEPSLRGLVHAGVMLLFAGICIEPVLFGDSSSSSSSSQTQTQPNDAHGMGIVFAGLGMFFFGSVGVSTLLLSTGESREASAGTILFVVASAVGLIASIILLRVMFLPVLNENIMSSHAYRSQGLALVCFTLGSMLSLLDTWQIVLTELGTNDAAAATNSPPWMVLLLDLMAYVFHRAFIGSILVGGGFGSSSENDSTLHRPRQLLRCRYRAFFSLVGINLSLSWFLCGQYVSSVLVLVSALLQWKERVLFCQRLHPQEIRRWKRGGDDNRASPSSSSGSGRLRSSRVTQQHWLQLVLLGGHRFSSTAFIAATLAFAFYAATLFTDGVLLHNNNNNSTNTMNLGGLDACLVKAVHVAAVWAAMMAIFPRLLLVASGSVAFHRVVKGVCALMSTVDVAICLGILFFTSKTDDDSLSFSSGNRVYILWARILGATLQSLAFGRLHVHTLPSMTDPSIELASLTTNEEEVDTVVTDSRRTSEQQQGLEDDTTNKVQETESNYCLQYYENVDAFAVWTWIVYFGTHVVHSCIWSSSSGQTNPTTTTTTSLIATEMQLSKIFHFQVITIGFYSSGIFRRDIMSWTIVCVFATLEMAGILACHYQQEQQEPGVWNFLSWDRIGMVVASVLLFWDCGVRLFRHKNDGWIETARVKKDETVGDGAGSVLFPN